MTIAFVTSQGATGSTMRGRVLPLARYLADKAAVHILGLESEALPFEKNIQWHRVGRLPFQTTPLGKQRLKGFWLAWNMLHTSIKIGRCLYRLRPDVLCVMKALPHTVLGVWLWRATTRRSCRIVLDCDDFELAANVLSSFTERAAVHVAERLAVSMASYIVAATPFLVDRLEQLSRKKTVRMIPTGFDTKALPGRLDYEKDPFRALYFGTLALASGHRVDLLPEIVAAVRKEIPAFKLVIAGYGDDQQRIWRRCQELGVTSAVDFKGPFSINEIGDILVSNKIGMIIDPSGTSTTERAKSSSRTLLAVAAGLPLITSNIGIRPYLIPESFHFRFFAEPNSVESYAEKIKKLIATPLTTSEQSQLQTYAIPFSALAVARQYSAYIGS